MGLWFSVYEELLKDKKIRRASKILKCSRCEVVGAMNYIWGWGLRNADRTGLILYADKEDIAEVLENNIDDRLDAEAFVEALITAGLLDDVNGALYIHNWDERQKYYFRFSDKRNRDRQTQREKREGGPESIAPTTAETVSKPAIKEYSAEFLEFWEEYPRKVDKGGAYKKYNARLKDGYSPAELREAAKQYAKVCKVQRTEEKFIKHAKTFLGDATPFVDYLPKEEMATKKGVDDNDPFADWR